MKTIASLKLSVFVFLLATFAISINAQSYPDPLTGLTTPGTLYSSIVAGASTTMTTYENTLYIAYAENGANAIQYVTSTDGATFGSVTTLNPATWAIQSSTTPYLIVWQNDLILIWVGNDGYVQYSFEVGNSGFSNPIHIENISNSDYVVGNSSPGATIDVHGNLEIAVVQNAVG